MRKRILLLVVFGGLSLLLTACTRSAKQGFTPTVAATSAPTSKPASTPVPVAVLLADALKYYEAGNYEEAILAYIGAIEIEPKNIDAYLGLGQSYRSAKRTDEAINTLLAARGIDAENQEIASELGFAYLESGRFEDAEGLMTSFWNNGEGKEEAGVLLVLGLAGQGRSKEVQRLLKNEKLQVYLKRAKVTEEFYFGLYNEQGQRSGNGLAMYSGGYVYAGEFKDGARSGQGVWYYPNGTYYAGMWEDDMPNGSGKLVKDEENGVQMVGVWKNGLEHGEMETWFVEKAQHHDNTHLGHWIYLADEGKPVPRYEMYGRKHFSYCQECGKLLWVGAWVPRGISPFVDEYEKIQIWADESMGE